jgi:hypothetical protein
MTSNRQSRSIKKDPVAHITLRLRFFLLKFYLGLPKEYINFLNNDYTDVQIG